jgi:hypothetical protein
MDQTSEVVAEVTKVAEEEQITELSSGMLDKIGGGVVGVLI